MLGKCVAPKLVFYTTVHMKKNIAYLALLIYSRIQSPHSHLTFRWISHNWELIHTLSENKVTRNVRANLAGKRTQMVFFLV